MIATLEELAYCAGVIDSDGCITIRCDKRHRTYSPRVQVNQVEPQAIQLLNRLFGGSSGKQRPHAKNGRWLYCWEVGHAKAEIVLQALLPFLRIKRRQAQNALDLREVTRTAKLFPPKDSYILDMMERMFQRSKELNQVGISEKSAAYRNRGVA